MYIKLHDNDTHSSTKVEVLIIKRSLLRTVYVLAHPVAQRSSSTVQQGLLGAAGFGHACRTCCWHSFSEILPTTTEHIVTGSCTTRPASLQPIIVTGSGNVNGATYYHARCSFATAAFHDPKPGRHRLWLSPMSCTNNSPKSGSKSCFTYVSPTHFLSWKCSNSLNVVFCA